MKGDSRGESPSGWARKRNVNNPRAAKFPPDREAQTMPTKDEVITVLKKCYDPEIPINIYDLGLVYNIDINEATGKVGVNMTLTAPGCPASAYMGADVKRKIEQLPGVKEAVVSIVWEPPWTPEMMSETAKKQFGWGI